MQKRIPVTQRFPYLIIAVGKHNTDYYLVDSLQSRDSVGVSIVKNWYEAGYYQKDTSISKTLDDFLVAKTGLTKQELEDIKNDPKLQKVKMQFSKYSSSQYPLEAFKSLTREYDDQISRNKICDQITQSIKNRDGNLAWEIIDEDSGGEYQEVRQVSFDNVNYDQYNRK